VQPWPTGDLPNGGTSDIVHTGMLDTVRQYLSSRDILLDLAFLASLAFACIAPRFAGLTCSAVERYGAIFARRKTLAIICIALFPVLLRLSLLPLLPVPVPHTHDEFSYLLAGDTFAHGRLTNPPHPMWIFLDTIHVNQHPTYMSKYPPAQGIALALGEILGNPWLGVVISVSGMCAAVLWMLQGWLPAPWALLGGILVVLRLGVFSYWMNSYWGGAVSAIGGALVVGALPRVLRLWRSRDALILAIGATVLAMSRPMEGLVLCLPVAVLLLARFCGRGRPPLHVTLWRFILPFCVTAFLCGLFIGYYNWRGTGSPLAFPYMVNEKAYLSTPTLFWEKARPPLHYMNPQFEAFYNDWMRAQWLEGRVDGVRQAIRHLGLSIVKVGYFFLWPELCVPFLALPWLLRDRRIRFLVVLTAISFLGFLFVPWTQAHYAAPLTAALFALVIQGIRHLRQWEPRGRPVGIALSRVVVLFAALLAPFHPHSQAIGNQKPEGIEFRAVLEAQLEKLPGKQLVIVRYSRQHPVLQEWVYNRADVDGAKIVWAREIPGIDLTPMLDYFRERQIWVVEADQPRPVLRPYVQ
jgi:hypothetical protein